MPIASELNIDNTADATTLMQTIFGSGVTITAGTATVSGTALQSATYSGGIATLGDIAPADTGIILSTGDAAEFTNDSGTIDTNTAAGTGTNQGGAGDADLNLVTGQTTFDAVVLEADFTTTGDFITMQFTFSSEEYLEYVNGGVNDAFGVWINGAYVPFTPAANDLVSIDTINDTTSSNLYLDNDATADTYNTEMDGTTLVLSIKAPVNSSGSNSIKIALADGGDGVFDSNVLIAANSVQVIALAFDDTVTMEANTQISVDLLANDDDNTGTGLTITEINGQDIVVGQTITLPTGEQITLNADGTVTIESDGDVGSETFTYKVLDGAGNTDIGFATINTEAAIPNDFIVEGTAGDDTIDAAYTGDPEGDRIDNLDHSDASNADSVEAGAGNDVVNSGAGNDTIHAGADNDTVDAGAGDDTIFGETGDDSLSGGADNDSIDAGEGDDFVSGGTGTDTILGGTGADTLTGDGGDDTFILEDGFGADDIQGGETNDATTGDTLDLSAVTDDLVVDLTDANAETGTVSDGTDTASFVEIENITLGSGADTIILADGSGDDVVSGFNTTDSGDGTTVDQLDVSGLTNDGGTTPVSTDDVVVTDTNGDGTGDAILTFPGGESITLVGVSPTEVDTPAELEAIGIPAAVVPLNYIVEGDGTANLIDSGYVGDPEGDQIDNSDALDGSQDDSVVGGAGDDTILSGLGDDSVDAGDDDDSVDGGAGSDTVRGGDGADTIEGGDDHDSLFGDDGDDSILGEAGNDTLEGGIGNDTLIGGAGNDSINGDFGDDSIVGGSGDDFLRGSFGDDTLVGGTGDDTLWGGFGDDSIVVDANFGDYNIEGEEEDETLGDTMDVSGVTDDLTWDLSNVNPEAGSFSDGTNTATFVDIENIVLGSGEDTLVLDTFGGSNTVIGFSAPTDTGGGTFSGNDLLDVSGLEDFDGNPTHTGNVTVTEVGGNAVLTFPNGESLTLVGVPAADVSSPAQLIAMGIPEGPDGYVDGTAGDDTIDGSYVGDPNFDLVDSDDALLVGMSGDDDYIRAGAGNDSVVANLGDDSVEGGTGSDTIEGGEGEDTLLGEAGDDSLVGGLGNDSLVGGVGDDTLNGQIGDDVLEGGDGSDSFALEDDFGNDTIVGGEVDDAAGDVLDMSGVGGALTYDLTGADSESGTVTDGVGTVEFSEIETIQLSSGTDTLTLSNTSGADSVTGFTAPTLAGDGSWIGFDQVDVSTMVDANGALVNTGDVTITDTNGDGTGDTILTFPGGATLTLVGVLPSAFPVPEALAAIGIPLADYIVEGTAAGEVIDDTYLGDPEGDLVDANDAEDGSNDDIIEAGAGDDTVTSGVGDDSIFADEGADEVDAGAGDDTVFGGDDGDTISGGADNDSLLGQEGADSISGDAGNDFIEGGTEDDTLLGGTGADTLDGGADNDSLEGGGGNDSLLGSFGEDTLNGGTGDDTVEGGFGDDTILLTDDFGDDVIDGGSDFETDGDVLDASGVTAEGVNIVYSGDETGTLTGAVTGDEADFFDIENITATDNDDTINAALDTIGVNVDAGDGEDVVTGGSGQDTLDGGDGDDVISGGTDGDSITGGAGDDTINVAQGDTVTGGDGDDFFNIVDLAEVDTDVITITGGEGDETDGDTLALNGLHDRDSLVITDPDDVNGGLTGTVTLLDGTVINFSNIENIICFVPGTEIATPYGARMIEDLKIGDRVVTQDNGVQKIRWIGKTTVPATGAFAPIRFSQSTFPGACGDLVVSPQHRMLFKGYQAELLFGEHEVLIPALHLLDGQNVVRENCETVTYIHIMFEQHEIIFAQGVATESFHPGSFGVDCLAPRARDELFTLFPEMRSNISSYGRSARTSLRASEAKALINW
ncbi:Hint domain-containing protein [Planktotalea sp.]|uniref:Hint domain-containing protein n=1 Tax=Planktotalea sp. TaxID=2029877 RepID=UPI003D6C09A9